MSQLQREAAEPKEGFSQLSGSDLDPIFMSQSQYLKREPSCLGNSQLVKSAGLLWKMCPRRGFLCLNSFKHAVHYHKRLTDSNIL